MLERAQKTFGNSCADWRRNEKRQYLDIETHFPSARTSPERSCFGVHAMFFVLPVPFRVFSASIFVRERFWKSPCLPTSPVPSFSRGSSFPPSPSFLSESPSCGWTEVLSRSATSAGDQLRRDAGTIWKQIRTRYGRPDGYVRSRG